MDERTTRDRVVAMMDARVSSLESIRISPGDVIDDFEIVEVLAVGGSSTTFRATHRTLAREVSLKFVHHGSFSDDLAAIDIARADATRVARVEHPGVAPVFAAGGHAGGLYVASAMPQGRTLADLGAERAITPADAARVLSDVAAALEAAHAQGVIHRDLRPDCITVDRWGHGVVRDFGVTRISGRTGLLTRAEVLESLRYTAPELVLGRPAAPPSDVYGLAAVAVWCLTGAPPYRDRPAAEYVLFRTSAQAPMLTNTDGIPVNEINTVLTAAMALEPAARPTLAEFDAALTGAIASLPTPVREAGCPLTGSERVGPLPQTVEPALALPDVRDATRVEQRRPLHAQTAPVSELVPWVTYIACAMVALTVGLAALLASRASAPQAAVPIRIGAFTLNAGDTWTRERGASVSKLQGVRLTGAEHETATVGVVDDARLPGDPVPADLLPDAKAKPRPVKSGRVALLHYSGPSGVVVARPSSKGTVVAVCSASTALARCAALVMRANGPGRSLPVLPSEPVSDGLRGAMTMIERASAIASAEFQGERSEQAAAAGRLATVLRESASGLNVDGVDPRTGAQLERLRRTLEEEGGAFEDLGGAIERRSDVAFDAARELVRASRRKLNTALATFKRAGYAVQ